MNKNELELRLSSFSTLGVRQVDGDSDAMQVSGIALPFNKMSEDLGGFREVIPDRVKVDYYEDDVFGLAHHDWTRILGRKSAGTYDIERTDEGFVSTYNLSNNPNNLELYQNIDRNEIRDQSFGFWVMREDWDITSELWIRYLEHIILAETSIVALGAYGDTDISRALRSMNQRKSEMTQKIERARDRQRFLDMLKLGPSVPTYEPAKANLSTGE